LRNYLQTEEGYLDLAQQTLEYHVLCAMAQKGALTLTVLHIACQYHSPADIVLQLAKDNQAWIRDVRDELGHNLIHVAATWGAHPTVVEVILSLHPVHASLKDKEGRAPVHLHCDFCCYPKTCSPLRFLGTALETVIVFKSIEASDPHQDLFFYEIRAELMDHSYQISAPIPLVVEFLHVNSPPSTNQEAKHDMTPIE
jgi:hypothetical protein